MVVSGDLGHDLGTLLRGLGSRGESLEAGRRRGEGSGRRMLLRRAAREECWDLA